MSQEIEVACGEIMRPEEQIGRVWGTALRALRADPRLAIREGSERRPPRETVAPRG